MSEGIDEIREAVTQAMSETTPSWGHRIHRVLAILNLDFGDADSIDFALMRDAHRTIRWNADALAAANADTDWPPLRPRFRMADQ